MGDVAHGNGRTTFHERSSEQTVGISSVGHHVQSDGNSTRTFAPSGCQGSITISIAGNARYEKMSLHGDFGRISPERADVFLYPLESEAF